MVLAALAGLACALAFDALGLPGGLVFGGMIGAAAVSLISNVELELPKRLDVGLQIVLGTLVGVRITPEFGEQVGAYLLPAVTASCVLIATGLVTARLLHRFMGEEEWIALATAPGGLETLLAVAIERRSGPAEVGLFHVIRVVLVVASLPLLLLSIG